MTECLHSIIVPVIITAICTLITILLQLLLFLLNFIISEYGSTLYVGVTTKKMAASLTNTT